MAPFIGPWRMVSRMPHPGEWVMAYEPDRRRYVGQIECHGPGLFVIVGDRVGGVFSTFPDAMRALRAAVLP